MSLSAQDSAGKQANGKYGRKKNYFPSFNQLSIMNIYEVALPDDWRTWEGSLI
jgi:hypothetical protein